MAAMVGACARILEERGYAGLSTNAIAEVAGVSIGSLYEYFPGKEAIVARLAEELLAETTAMLHQRLALTDNRNDLPVAMRHFLGALYSLMHKHRRLLRVLVFQVPYMQQLPATRQLQQELQQVLQTGLQKTRQHYQQTVAPTTLYLMATSTAGTLLHLVLMAPARMEHGPVLDALAQRLATWVLDSE
ncbi:TetR family transcriptional regulator [Alcanivorax hongdengensis A-11-3]|uniref:TetR family transcriptional regulator n=1 Tax=Alcanivorax hongdengensis A-11-3 TaxID=1177179 RepID=L0W9B2_9GAMM|nr:TetR family transcriptional regulator [Alcanivorax hongdengensis A-11-3]